MAEKCKLDFSNLVKNGKYIDCGKSYGKVITFEYGTIKGEFVVLDRIGYEHINIMYNNEIFKVPNCSLRKGIISGILNKGGYKHSIGEIINNDVDNFIINDRYSKRYIESGKERGRRFYLCECFKHNYEFEVSATGIDKNIGCPICHNSRPVLGYNTLYDLRKDLLIYLKNKEDAKKHFISSNSKIRCICPNCNIEKDVYINNLSKNGFYCDYCNDGLSYPNKFIRNFLFQLNIDFESEKVFKWSNKKRYDEYIPLFNMIIENHGNQHFEKNSLWRDDQENDVEKKELAYKNGIANYIELDCRESSIEYIKNSILISDLPNILNFNENDIDWNQCGLFASSNLIKNVWDDWNLSNDYKYMKNKYNFIHIRTIREYIDKGVECGYCNNRFFAKDFKNHLPLNSPVYCITNQKYYSSIIEFSKTLEKQYDSLAANIVRGIERNGKFKNYELKIITKEEYDKYYFNEVSV